MKKKLFYLITFLALATIKAQNSNELFTGNLTVQPFLANTLEPKLGFLFHSSENELRLDIGNSLDIIQIRRGNIQYSFGADLFTYTRLRKEGDFHFPVDAVDYLFGVNFGYKMNLDKYEVGARLRISHISTHMVDGHYDNTLNTWKDGHPPRVYSREFVELMPYIKYNDFRLYAGLTYIFHIDPTNIGKDNFQIGFDYFLPWKPLDFIHPFIAYDLKLIHLDSYTANNCFEAGFKFGRMSLYYQYYAGNSVHGQYYESKVEYSAIGINLDL